MTLWIIAVLAALGVLGFADTAVASITPGREAAEDDTDPESGEDAKPESVEDQYDHEPSDEDDEGAEASEESGKDDDESKADESGETDETPSPEDRGFDENLLALAQGKFGISRETALSYSSPSDLLRTLTHLGAQQQASAAAAAKREAELAGGQQNGQQHKRPAPPKFDLKALVPNLDTLPDEFHPVLGKIGEHVDSVTKFYDERMQQLEGVLVEMVTDAKNRAEQDEAVKQIEFADKFDGFIKESGPEWEKELGKGTWRTLQNGDPALATRERIIETMGTIRGLFQGETEKQLYDRALTLLYPNKKTAQVTKKIAEGLKKNASQITRKPVAKGKGAGTDPYEKAGRRIEKFQRAASAGRVTWDDGDTEV